VRSITPSHIVGGSLYGVKMDNLEIKIGGENMDIALIYDYLSNHSYWAQGIPLKTVESSLQNSFCVGVFATGQQIAFARLITDYATFAYLADVFVIDEWQKQGVGKLLLQHITELDWVQNIRRFMLATKDAHGLYKQFGFTELSKPERLMEIVRPAIYER